MDSKKESSDLVRSPKTKRKLDTSRALTAGSPDISQENPGYKKNENSKAKDSVKSSKKDTSSGNSSGKTSCTSPGKDNESKKSSKAQSTDQSSSRSEEKNAVCPKSKDSSKDNSPSQNKKATTPKIGKSETKSDSPPDLVLFLKEGRGRAQNWSEPPTLDPESIATRRRTRVPEDPAALLVGKSKQVVKKEVKEQPRKDLRKEKKIKVMETPESLKRLAQEYPVRDSTRSPNAGKGIADNVVETKCTRKSTGKSATESSSQPSSSDEQQIIVRRSRGRPRISSDMEVVSKGGSIKDTKTPTKESLGQGTGSANPETVITRMSRSRAGSSSPSVVMSDSDSDAEVKRASLKNKKKQIAGKNTSSALKLAEYVKSKYVKKEATKEECKVTSQPEKKDQSDSKQQKSSDIKVDKVTEDKLSCQNPVNNKSVSSDNQSRLTESASKVVVCVASTPATGQSHTGMMETRVSPVKRQVTMEKSLESNEMATTSSLPRSSESHGSGGNNVTVTPSSKSSHSPGVSNLQKQQIVKVPRILSYRVAAVGAEVSPTSPRKVSLNLKGILPEQLLRNSTSKVKELVNKNPSSSMVKVVAMPNNDNNPLIQKASLPPQKGPLYEYTDIETEEVIVGGENDESAGNMNTVGKVNTKWDLLAREDTESSSDDENTKSTELCPVPKKEMMSPEGRVALDHSYSSGSSEMSKGSSSARKKSPITYEKTMSPRPVYSSSSLAKRSLDIMLHNDKINILRQMSQIFNDEKPPQLDTDDNTMSSSDGEEEKEIIKSKTLLKSKKVHDVETPLAAETQIENTSTEGTKNQSTPNEAEDEKSDSKTNNCSSGGLPAKSIPSKVKVDTPIDKTRAEQVQDECKIITLNTSSESDASLNPSSDKTKDDEHSQIKVEQLDEKPLTERPTGKTAVGSPFHGFPDTDPKVHHVPSYTALGNEKIHVQSSVGPGGETVDIIDGFTFVSFSTIQEMEAYDSRLGDGTLKLRRKKRRRKGKKIHWTRQRRTIAQEPSGQVHVQVKVHDSQNTEQEDNKEHRHSGAFASNDLDAFLDNNSRLNISYTIPKCQATEEGVTKLDEHEIMGDVKHTPVPTLPVPDPIPIETSSDLPDQSNSAEPSGTENGPSTVHQYEEVNAIDILYPKEKYKYYYNKELCKDTKADGSSVFVRRAGKLVPLNSVFKSQTVEPEASNKKFVELVYVYDGGQLLTLGGSLTKINPSNSDSVRARVVLPIGVPPIMKGEAVGFRSRNIEAVEINEDMAKFALTALWDPNPAVPKSPETKAEMELQTKTESVLGSSTESEEIGESKDDVKLEEKKDVKVAKKEAPVKPTKTNILDIIAAKLAMSDDESDEKEEVEGDKVNTDKKTEVDVEVECDKANSDDKKTEVDVDRDNSDDNMTKLNYENLNSKVEMDAIKSDSDVDNGKEKVEDVGDTTSKQKTDEDISSKEEDPKSGKVKEENDSSVKEEVIFSEEDGGVRLMPVEEKPSVSIKDTEELLKEELKEENGKELPESLVKDTDEKRSKDTDEKRSKDIDERKGKDEHSAKHDLDLSVTKTDASENASEADAKVENPSEADDKVENSLEDDDKDKLKDVTDLVNSAKESSDPEESVKTEDDSKLGIVSASSSVDALSDTKSSSSSSQELGDETDSETPKIHREDLKARMFKKNIYRFPSLSREMKRLNMNFVNYVHEPPLEEEVKGGEPKGECKHEHCKLGCICESLACHRRNVEHCGRVECMFECSCRDQSWKHSVSNSGRTINSVSIFNLDREQNEGLALREKDFKRTVIQTGSEVILVGAERRKRERKIPGRFRDSTIWPGTDYVQFETSRICDPPTQPLPLQQAAGIPLSEASKYIKNFKLNIPWYDIKGISIWCMDHSCYDCRCLSDPIFHQTHPSVLEANQVNGSEDVARKITGALDTLEDAIKPGQTELEQMEDLKDFHPCCTVVNIIVNNTEAKRRYSWKLKEWSHASLIHCARTAGYTRENVSQETKNLTISGLSAKDTTPQQIVETVVKSFRNKHEKLLLPPVAIGENLEPLLSDSLTNLQSTVGLASEPSRGRGRHKSDDGVPVVDLTANTVEEMDATSLPTSNVKLIQFRPSDGESSSSMKRKRGESTSPASKRMHLARTIYDEGLITKSVVPTTAGLYSVGNAAISQTFRSQNTPECPRLGDKTKAIMKKSLSLLDMMMAEEKRGELELDLRDCTPGNALLVAEARFRKLINMNIIGVIGINKAGRCIIGTVDSIDALRVMQRIHNMIINNTLDVGPNMREIFFPPPYTGTRPRFVMIRCDLNRKWEIVGVVQKKDPAKPRNPDFRGRLTTSKSSSCVPQVIDLEEEETQKSGNPDVVMLSEQKQPEPTSPTDKEGGVWEGSLPTIASVHSASDSNMAEIIGSPNSVIEEAIESQPLEKTSQEPSTVTNKELQTGTDKEPETGLSQRSYMETFRESQIKTSQESCMETSQGTKTESSMTPHTEASQSGPLGINKSIPDLVPISSGVVEKLSQDGKKKCDNTDTQNVLPVSFQQGPALQQTSQHKQLFFVPTAFNVSSKAASTVSTLTTTTPAMKTMKLNMASGRIFGNYQGDNVHSGNSAVTLGVSPGTSSESSASGPGGLGKLSILLPKDSTGTTKSEAGVLASSKYQAPVVSGAIIHPALSSTASDGSGGGGGASATLSSKRLCLPPSSVSKVVLVPSMGSGTSPRMMLVPAIPGTTPTDSTKMKMVLMQSPQENNKMILIPASTDPANTSQGSGLSESDKKKMLVLPSNILGNLISRPPGPVDQMTRSKTLGSTLGSESPTSQASCKGTLLVPINSAAALQARSAAERGETCNKSAPEVTTGDKTGEESSDDVVVIGSASNRLTITRMRTSQASSAFGSISAETNVVTTIKTISSTMPMKTTGSSSLSIAPQSTTPAASGNTGVATPGTSGTTIKQFSNPVTLNTLLSQTHSEMVTTNVPDSSSGETKDISGTLSEYVSSEAKHMRELDLTSQASGSHLSDDNEKNGVEIVEETRHKTSPIKKMGYHWSAVDLSLNFKSVKLEWLLGTIRKNVLVNIYKMSLKTHSPVTLSVKNGTSSSMLYGMARVDDRNENSTLPILILGSVVSAVMSSSSTPDSRLFQLNSIKYFIRESTGELSSYTYDTTGTYLVKIASKKRGDGGEMIGIGEKVSIEKMREECYVNKSHQAQEKNINLPEVKEKCASGSASTQDDGGCSCTAAGDFMCMGHSAPQDREFKLSLSHQAVPVPKSDNKEVFSSQVSDLSCGKNVSAPEGKGSRLEMNSHPQNECPTKPLGKDTDKLPSEVNVTSSAMNYSSDEKHKISADQQKSVDYHIPVHEEFAVTTQKHNFQEEGIEERLCDPMSGVKIVNVKGNQPMNSSYLSANEDAAPEEANQSDDGALDDETEEVDILGGDDDSQSILFNLRQQMEDEGPGTPRARSTSSFSTPAEVAKRILAAQAGSSMQGRKRKIEETQMSFDKPCPRSRKVARVTQPAKQSRTILLESPESEAMVTPSHLAHLRAGGDKDEDLVRAGSSGTTSHTMPKFNVVAAKTKFGKNCIRLKKKEKPYVDVEGYTEERNAEVHNELERMRRRVMRHLFCHLQKCLARIPNNPLTGETAPQPKNAILNVAMKVCEMLRVEEMKLWLEEEKIRQERSAMIKNLASMIADGPEETRLKWRHWVRDNMQNPTAKQTFEKRWTPFNLERDILMYKSGESSFDMDLDDGSPLPGPSSPLIPLEKTKQQLQQHAIKLKTAVIRTDATTKLTRVPETPKFVKVPDTPKFPTKGKESQYTKLVKKTVRGKKFRRPQKLVVDNSYQNLSTGADATPIPTSILLMAGTSSRGRKIVRKEDINFVSK